MTVSFIPQNVERFYTFLEMINHHIITKRQNDNDWENVLLQSRVDELYDAQTMLRDAMQAAKETPTPALIAERKRVQTESERVLRGFIRQYLHFPPVTDLDRNIMGIPNHDTIRTDHTVVNEHVDYVIHLRGIRELVVEFWVLGNDNRAKPTGYDGAVVVWDILDAPPERPESLNRHSMASRTPFIIDFDETERGKTAYIALAWQNERGILGKWSEIKSAIVP